MKKRSLQLFILLLLLAACSSAAPPENETPPPVAPDPITAVPQSTEDAGQPAALDTSVTYGRNDDGTFFHGAAGAPVTLTDYSDFL